MSSYCILESVAIFTVHQHLQLPQVLDNTKLLKLFAKLYRHQQQTSNSYLAIHPRRIFEFNDEYRFLGCSTSSDATVERSVFYPIMPTNNYEELVADLFAMALLSYRTATGSVLHAQLLELTFDAVHACLPTYVNAIMNK